MRWRALLSVFLALLNNGARTLRPPSGLSVDSVDMRHTLRWRPPQAACSTSILYSVQFQGEFELTVLNGSWLDAAECQGIPSTHCDLTFDLGSDSDYNLRVRARCGPLVSAWAPLGPPFNRRRTALMAPDMTVSAVGDALQVTFHQLPLTAVAVVTLWKTGDKQQAAVYSVPAELPLLHVAALQDGAEYCVRAYAVLGTRLQSSSTESQCVSITGADAAWKRPTTVTVTVVAMAGLLFAVFWSVVHWRPRVCQSYFHKEPLPEYLRTGWDVENLTRQPEVSERLDTLQGLEKQETETSRPEPQRGVLAADGLDPHRPQEILLGK